MASAVLEAGPPRHQPTARPLQGGDEEAFRRLVEGQRASLYAHCYRMLGSLHDAEDALQETMVRSWRGLPRYEGRSSPSTWLHRIATNVCLDAIGRRRRRKPIDEGPRFEPGEAESQEWVRDPVWIEPLPDEALGIADGAATPEARYERREALELALSAALQHLPGRQRAVLLLRDGLGFSAKEVSEILDSSVASTNSALQRARRTLAARRPEPSRQATPRSLEDARTREVIARLVDAFERADVDGILGLLAEDAGTSMRVGARGGGRRGRGEARTRGRRGPARR
jgi:RNA polymerase sigma-70 factor (ECF subfamily)